MGNNITHFPTHNNTLSTEVKSEIPEEIIKDPYSQQQQKLQPPDRPSGDIPPQPYHPQNYNQPTNQHKYHKLYDQPKFQQSYNKPQYHINIEETGLDLEEEEEIVENDFNYSKLGNLLEKIDKKKENIILLTTGSFNPIHRMHLEILNIAANFLLLHKKYNVLCGFISPSADCYVKSKKPPLIPFDLRCKMIKTAINEYNLEYNKIENKKENLKIFLHPWEGSQDKFIDFPYVIKEIQSRISKYNIKLVYVCGLDLFINCRNYFSKNVIAVDRKPYQNNNKYKSIPGKLIYIIKDDKTEPYSSTYIKECFAKNDYKSIEKVTFPKVAKMIIDFYEKNFKY